MKSDISLKKIQRLEITCEMIYHYLAHRIKHKVNAEVLHSIAEDEKKHYDHIKQLTGIDVKPFKLYMWTFRILSRILGLTFGIKMIENKEEQMINRLSSLDLDEIFMLLFEEGKEHEQELFDIIDEERLKYLGLTVLGLNDALVELSGVLAGYTFAFAETRLISVAGLITGITAAMSMAASAFLSTRVDNTRNALKSALYTGLSYIITVAILILPYFIISNPYISLAVTLSFAMLIIAGFSFYMSVVQDFVFKKRFTEMAVISLGVATISFVIGILVNNFIGL